MCGLFCLRSCAGGTKTGLGNFEFFGIFGNCGSGMKIFRFFGKFEFFGFQKGCRSLHILFKVKYILKNVYYSLYIHFSIYKYTLKEVSPMLKILNLIYINGRLASNEDLKSLLKDECRYGERALRTVHYTHTNVRVIKYSTRW